MQIILLDKVVNLGGLGDVVKVKDGYARNYLIPQGKAKRANAANLAEFEARRAELERLAAEQLAAAQAEGEKLEGQAVSISRKAGVDGRLFGSVTNADIAEALKAKGFSVEKSSVRMPEGPLKVVGDQIAASALTPSGKDAKTLLDEAEAKVFEIAEAGARTVSGFVPIQPILGQVVDRIQELYDRDSPAGITGVPTGLADLDEKTSGLQPSDMIVLAARPGMGKTSLALNIAETVAVEAGLPVAVFSMEMPGTQLATRFLSSVGRIDQHKIRTGKLNDEEWQRLTYALGKLHEAPIYIDETPGLNPTDLRARCRRLHRQCGRLGLIVIDYLQLMTSLKESDNRSAELSEISRSVKSLAKELNVPIIALSQLNRSLEQRPNKRPVASDLRESGAIEQDADIIMFIYRDEIYNPDSPDKGMAELIISKHRNGSTGTIRMTFLGEFNRFENFAGTYMGSAPPEY